MSTTTNNGILLDSIPQELKDLDQHVVWRRERNKQGKWDKFPYSTNGALAETNNPQTWDSFPNVVDRYHAGGYSGIGFVFHEADRFCGIDLDGCRDPATGKIAAWATGIIKDFNSYTEISPSGSGVKIFITAASPLDTGKNKRLKGVESYGEKNPGIEVYDKLRYFALTGMRLPETSPNVEPRQAVLNRYCNEWFPQRESHGPNSTSGQSIGGALEQARQYIAKIPGAVSGDCGHNRTYQVACVLALGFNLSQDDSLALIKEWNATCQPPWSDGELLHKIEDAGKEDGKRGYLIRGDKPTIVVGPDEHRVNDEAIAALAADHDVYSRDGKLVRVIYSKSDKGGIHWSEGSARIAPVKEPTLQERLTKYAQFVRCSTGADGEQKIVNVPPPKSCVEAVNCRGQYDGIRALDGITDVPTLRPDGTILTVPGYDTATRLVFIPRGTIPAIPERPTREDALSALDLLYGVFSDFPFQRDEHRSAMIAAVLTPFARTAFRDCAPANVIDANMAGVGKGLAATVTGIIWSGGDLPVMDNPKDNEESRKRITSLLLRGTRFGQIDNVTGTLGGSAIEAMITAKEWGDRLLSKNEDVTAPIQLTWLITANNCAMTPDMTRRVNHIRLFTEMEKPDTRTGFRHSDLAAYVRENRPQLVAACLTIIRAYIVAGRPDVKILEWGSFAAWSQWVRAPLVWLGCADPAKAREELRSTSDRSAGALQEFIWALALADPNSDGMTSAQIAHLLDPDTGSNYTDLRNAVFELCGGGPKSPPSVGAIGSKLRTFRGRNVGGSCIDSDKNRKGAARWLVRILTQPASQEGAVHAVHAGLVLNPYAGAHTHTQENPYGAEGETSPASPASPALLFREPGDESEWNE